jgi:16S rRNA (adenine1518-N6/adenine1519-N6)-dimethyltransferase
MAQRRSRLSRGERDTPGADEARLRLRAHGLSPRKASGQHFLIDSPILERIVEAAGLEPGDVVVEIGPGLGVLTRALAQAGSVVLAIELDHGLARVIQLEAPAWGDVRLRNADALDVDIAEYRRAEGVAGRPYRLVANLPYAITSPVLRRFLTSQDPPERVVVMVQREVAQRVAARPGDWSYLAVVARLYGTPSIVATVPRAAFYPPPQVESAVLLIEPHKRPPLEMSDRGRFLDFVLAGFGHPRKQLHNALARAFWFEEGEATKVLQEVGIDPGRRAQTLSLEEWYRLYERMVAIEKA